ncbi:DUF2339 domain-containing protein [Paenibacillus sp. KS-LC4]|uniref:DUF2339 domain-containing protein n=1 Tax=Paenibacillus sp. KS-LC4 TaxID=2979727 RepID=UPI0030CFEF19
MNIWIRKQWTLLLGVLFVLSAFVTLFKYTVEQGWVTNAMKIGLGLLSGAGFAAAGFSLIKREKWPLVGELSIGLGACLLYMTAAFAGVYYEMWDSMTVLLGMTAVTAALTVYAYRFESRLLTNIALTGGLLSPLLMRPETDQVFTLFLYMLVLNSAFFWLSTVKSWNELRLISFIGSWIMYIVYFFTFDPIVEGVWNLPLRYALAAFLFYQIGFLLASRANKQSFDGMNMFAGLSNGVIFGFWSLLLIHGEVHYAYPLAFIGFVLLLAGSFIHYHMKHMETASATYGSAGVLLMLLALNQVGSGLAVKPIVNVFLWSTVAALLVIAGKRFRWQAMNLASLIIWFTTVCYWYVITWFTPRGEWFGVFIPFLNWGAMAWLALAALGFYYSARQTFASLGDAGNRVMGNMYALCSHLIIGGLLTVQMIRLFQEHLYDLPGIYMQLSLSASWGVYALLLVLWGVNRGQSVFRWFGFSVLGLTAIKAIFFDLNGQESLYKVLVLLLLGGISFLIAWINGKWNKVRELGDQSWEQQSAESEIKKDNG